MAQPAFKPLAEHVQDLRDMASMLIEQANAMEQLVLLFAGGRPVASAPPPPAPPAPPAPVPQREPHVEEAPPKPKKAAPKRVPLTGPSRVLSAEEKAAIRADWATFPKHLQTVENRRALAAKYRCSGTQMFALLRGSEHFSKMSSARYREQQEQQQSHT